MGNIEVDRGVLLEQASALHKRIITFDAHIDIPKAFGTSEMPADVDGAGQFDMVKVGRGELSGAALVVHATVARQTASALAKARGELERSYAQIKGLANDYPKEIGIALSPSELRQLRRERKFAVVVSFQNSAPLEDDLSRLAFWAERGVRLFAFNFIGNNSWSDSARPYPFIAGNNHWNGLSEIGKRAVPILNDLGVIIDVSQMSSMAFAQVLSITRSPVVASHSAVRGIVDVDRNLSDEELFALKANGGVVHIVGFSLYVRPLEPIMRARLRDLWEKYGLKRPDDDRDLVSVNDPTTSGWDDDKFWDFLHEFHVILELEKPGATTRDLVDSIDYAVDRIGIDHVGISSDFNHAGGLADWADVGQSLNVTAELISRGYTHEEIEKLWGGNFFRIWDQVLASKRPSP